MGRPNRRAWTLVLEVAVAIILVAGIVFAWGLAPDDIRGTIVVVAGVVAGVAYVLLYAIQRRAHWGS